MSLDAQHVSYCDGAKGCASRLKAEEKGSIQQKQVHRRDANSRRAATPRCALIAARNIIGSSKRHPAGSSMMLVGLCLTSLATIGELAAVCSLGRPYSYQSHAIL